MLEHDSIMYFPPYRHDANVKESMLNNSTSTLLDSGSSARPFTTSFSAQSGTAPVFHHGVQGLHNASYNMQSVPNALSSRNPGLGGGPTSGAHQPAGSLPTGRFGSNNLPTGLSQLPHGGLHGHSSMTSRSGISVVGNHAFSSSMNGVGGSGLGSAPGAGTVGNRGAIVGLGSSPSQMVGSGQRIASSAGSIGGGAGVSLTAGGGGSLSRNLSSGGGLTVASLNGSRVNMGPLSNTGGIGVQGPGRPVNSMLQQGVNLSSSTYLPSDNLLAMINRASTQQTVSLLGSNFASSQGAGIQVPTANGQLGSIGLGSDGNSGEGVAFDINDFPQLSTRQSSGGGLQAALRQKGVAVNAIVQQNQEFSIQNEDFPALPGLKAGSADMSGEIHPKDQQHENTISSIQSQHFPMGRSAGFSLGSPYVPHRQQQQQQHQSPGVTSGLTSGSSSTANSSDISHLHSAVQSVGPPGTGGAQNLRSGGPSGVGSNLGSYDQLVHQYQQHQQSQFRLGSHQQQLANVGQSSRDLVKAASGNQGTLDRFGLLGLLSVIRMSDPDLTTLALGTDLTTLGLNLNSRENLYKTFASPWADGPIKGEPEFTLPQCYVQQAPRLQSGYFAKFQPDTLFYIFYSMPNDEAQLYAADELCNRGWFYHKEHHMWFARVPNVEPLVKTNTYERGSYYYFDHNTWQTDRKENFVLHYEMLEKRPPLPSQH